MLNLKFDNKRENKPGLLISCIPVVVLLCSIVMIILNKGASSVIDYGYILLLGASIISIILGKITTSRRLKHVWLGIKKSSRQILPTIPILAFIGTLSATWMMSGVVPTLICYGIRILNPDLFLFLTCLVCSVVSVVTGSSWTTIATIGVAFMGIGEMFGFPTGWIAGAIISGAYFGDKVSPLSDTTVLAASTTGVDLFSHIRFMMFTTIPSMVISLIVFAVAGFVISNGGENQMMNMEGTLERCFNISPWVLTIPLVTLILISFRLRTDIVLGIGSLVGLIGMFIFQPQIVNRFVIDDTLWEKIQFCLHTLCLNTSIPTGNELLDGLISTGGIEGMLPTIYLVLSAMVFGGVMIGTGMLGTITDAIIYRLHDHKSVVGTTVVSGIFLNSCTGDQYLSLIIGGNIFKNTYRKMNMRPLVLSRSLEDSISVTSVLIPWNSCGVAQSTVLGVATLMYLPYCVFNILSPLMSLTVAWLGWKIKTPVPASSPR